MRTIKGLTWPNNEPVTRKLTWEDLVKGAITWYEGEECTADDFYFDELNLDFGGYLSHAMDCCGYDLTRIGYEILVLQVYIGLLKSERRIREERKLPQ